MIDAGSKGLCILANFPEQFVLTDAERGSVAQVGRVDALNPATGDRPGNGGVVSTLTGMGSGNG
jgi:hypothetical protein